jgi:hypothetical protein
MHMAPCKYHLQSLNPLVVARYPDKFFSFFPSIIINYIIRNHKKNDGTQNASLAHSGIYWYGVR